MAGFGPDTFPSAASPLTVPGEAGRGLRIASPWYRLLVSLWSRTETSQRFVGEMVGWPLIAPIPANWFRCNGQAISRTVYAGLFAISGGGASPFGPGDGVTTFNVPNIAAIAANVVWIIKAA